MKQVRFNSYSLYFSKFAYKIKCKPLDLNEFSFALLKSAGKSVRNWANWFLYYETQDELEAAAKLLSDEEIAHEVHAPESDTHKEFLQLNQTVSLRPNLPFGKYRYAALVTMDDSRQSELTADVKSCNGRSVFVTCDWNYQQRKYLYTYRIYVPSETDLMLISIKHNPAAVTEFVAAHDIVK